MKIIEQGYSILKPFNGPQIIEIAGRTCYKSEDRITQDSAEAFVEQMIKKGHEAMLEHDNMTVKFITDRGVSHEFVRHRIASYAQESTRYCNYSGRKFGAELSFIYPVGMEKNFKDLYISYLKTCETVYMDMVTKGCSPQMARSVLPNSLKTEIVVTANLREWRHIFQLRTSPAAHPQIIDLLEPLLWEVMDHFPCYFLDFKEKK